MIFHGCGWWFGVFVCRRGTRLILKSRTMFKSIMLQTCIFVYLWCKLPFENISNNISTNSWMNNEKSFGDTSVASLAVQIQDFSLFFFWKAKKLVCAPRSLGRHAEQWNILLYCSQNLQGCPLRIWNLVPQPLWYTTNATKTFPRSLPRFKMTLMCFCSSLVYLERKGIKNDDLETIS